MELRDVWNELFDRYKKADDLREKLNIGATTVFAPQPYNENGTLELYDQEAEQYLTGRVWSEKRGPYEIDVVGTQNPKACSVKPEAFQQGIRQGARIIVVRFDENLWPIGPVILYMASAKKLLDELTEITVRVAPDDEHEQLEIAKKWCPEAAKKLVAEPLRNLRAHHTTPYIEFQLGEVFLKKPLDTTEECVVLLSLVLQRFGSADK